MIYGEGDYKYELVDGWGKYPDGWECSDVTGICTDAQDRVYVLNRGAHPVMVFDRNGMFITSWGEDFFSRPHGCCVGPDDAIYCTDDINHTVSKFTIEGKLLMVLGKKGVPSDSGYVNVVDTNGDWLLFKSLATIQQGGPPFNKPTGVSLSSSEDLFVSDGYGNARVHKFNSKGELLLSWGEPGSGPGQFILPHSVRLDKSDRVWVADRENKRIQIFDVQGNFLTQWADDLGRPQDICIDKDNIVYITEGEHGVSIFTMDKQLLSRWGSRGETGASALFVAPHDIAVDSHGDIYIGEVPFLSKKNNKASCTIQKFARIT